MLYLTLPMVRPPNRLLEEGNVDTLHGLLVNNLQCLEAMNMIAV